MSKGTGLGLSQVYGFINQSGGHVKIYSEVGEGTVIKIHLPRAISAVDRSNLENRSFEIPDDSKELILVVEDEPAVREFSIDALSEADYRVLEADGGEAALALIEK